MNEGLLVCGALVLALLSLLAIERWAFRRARRRMPQRVHVNGIRGKSSVPRLIAAGLRAGGIKTWAKVTGTLPRLIDEHGGDVPITRSGAASIGEQRAVITEAARAGVGALVIECMALKPLNQSVAEDGFVAAHAAVITNVREDHVGCTAKGGRARRRRWQGRCPDGGSSSPRRALLYCTCASP